MSTTASKPSRVETIDIVKGIAIVLVVIGHVAQGMYARGMWPAPSFLFLDRFIYTFHMPAFFLVAGFFLESSYHKRGSKLFILEKAKTVLYPYLLWCFITIVTLPLVAQYKTISTSFNWKEVVDQMLRHDSSWFLITLFICQLMAVTTIRIPAWLRLFLAILLASVFPHLGITPIDRPILSFAFVALGMWIGSGFRIVESTSRIMALAASAGLFACLGYLVRGEPSRVYPNIFFLGVLGTFALVLISRTLEHTFLSRVFVWLGEASIAIYLISPFGQGAGRMAAHILHSDGFWGYFLASSFVAIIVPALIWHSQKYLPPISWLFQWSARKPRS